MTRIIPFLVLLSIAAAPIAAQDFGRRERPYDAQHYRIEVSFDEAAGIVRGTTTITLRPLRSAFRVAEFDAVSMRIEAVTLPSGPALQYRNDSARLSVTLDRAYAYGEKVTLRVRYQCKPERGLYFIAPNASHPADPSQIWTQGQGEDNRHWFPCYDYPNDKATTEVIMTVRGDYETLSNGVLKSRKKNADGTVTWHWAQEQPHSVYLVMLAAGHYKVYEDSWAGIPVRSYHYPADPIADVRRAYSTTAEMLKFFSEKIGIRYPWPKYAQIPVAHYLYGGMENTTATVLNDTRVVVDPRTAQDISPEGLIAHELAHQWWGDYLTYIDWNNAWLNEGFATYFQQCWTQYKHGEDEFAYQRREGVRGYTDWCDSEGRVPVVSAGPNSRHNHYAKGAAVLHMLRLELGEELFWRVMKAYGEKFAFGSVETNDLKRVIEDVTGRNLQWFFSQWVLKAGYPDVRVTQRWDAGRKQLTLSFRQVQKIDSLCGTFRLTIPVRVFGNGRDTAFLARIDGSVTDVTVPFETEPVFVRIDEGATVCGRITLEQSDAAAIAALRGTGDVAHRIETGRALAARIDDAAVRKAVFDAACSDAHWGVRFQLANALVPASSAGGEELRALWLGLLRDPAPKVRATALSGLNALRDGGLRDEYLRLLRDSSYYVEAGALNCLLTIDSTSDLARAAVLERLGSRSYQDVVALAAMDWVQRYHMSDAEGVLLTLARPGGSAALRSKAVATLASIGADPRLIFDLLREQLDEPDWQFRVGAAQALMALAPRDGAALVRERLARETHSRAARELRAVLSTRR